MTNYGPSSGSRPRGNGTKKTERRINDVRLEKGSQGILSATAERQTKKSCKGEKSSARLGNGDITNLEARKTRIGACSPANQNVNRLCWTIGDEIAYDRRRIAAAEITTDIAATTKLLVTISTAAAGVTNRDDLNRVGISRNKSGDIEATSSRNIAVTIQKPIERDIARCIYASASCVKRAACIRSQRTSCICRKRHPIDRLITSTSRIRRRMQASISDDVSRCCIDQNRLPGNRRR